MVSLHVTLTRRLGNHDSIVHVHMDNKLMVVSTISVSIKVENELTFRQYLFEQ